LSRPIDVTGDEALLIVAADNDRAALAWARRDASVQLVTPRDLHTSHWALRVGGNRVSSHAPLDVDQVQGVVTRLPYIVPDMLASVRAVDREYAAAESTAFLTAWLMALGVPVLNSPVGGALCGDLNPLAVQRAAAAVGWRLGQCEPRPDRGRNGPVRTTDVLLSSIAADATAAAEVNVIDGRAVRPEPARPGGSDAGPLRISGEDAAAGAEHIAHVVGAALVRVRLYPPRPGDTRLRCLVDPWVDVASVEVTAAVRDAIRVRRPRSGSAPTSVASPSAAPAGRRARRVAIWGRVSDAPVIDVANALRRIGNEPTIIDSAESTAVCDIAADRPVVQTADSNIELADVDALYFRPYETSRALALVWWLDFADLLVVNRPRAMSSNNSKPYQAQAIIAAGFASPETLVTTDACEAREFITLHGGAVYKSISGVRSVAAFADADDLRLRTALACPTQFQRRIPGADVRVHVVGHKVFACRIAKDAIDYRYAARTGHHIEMTETTLPSDVSDRAVRLCADLGLHIGGLDLRQDVDGSWVCFEANPSPAFSFFDRSAHDGRVAAAVADLLSFQRPHEQASLGRICWPHSGRGR
jgi:glutathione synthase/RimK-type ligase-like ATP-grasp enzyme